MEGFGLKPPPDFLNKPGTPKIPWEQWISLFECFMGASGALQPSPEHRQYLLRHCLGLEGQRIFDTLPSSRAVAVPSQATTSAAASSPASSSVVATPKRRDVYQEAVDSLSAHFQRSCNINLERHRFRRRYQRPEESLSDYLTDLRALAVPANFGPQQDENIREQFTAGVLSTQVPERLLLESNLPFDQAVQIVLNIERTKAEAKELTIATEQQSTCHVAHNVQKVDYHRQFPRGTCGSPYGHCLWEYHVRGETLYREAGSYSRGMLLVERKQTPVTLCSNHSRNGWKLYGVPTNAERSRLWLVQIKRDDWEPSRSSSVCGVFKGLDALIYDLRAFLLGGLGGYLPYESNVVHPLELGSDGELRPFFQHLSCCCGNLYIADHLDRMLPLSYLSTPILNLNLLKPEALCLCIATSICQARLISRSIQKKILLVEVQSFFGGVKPSQGHAQRVSKILRSEKWRQVRLLTDVLRARCPTYNWFSNHIAMTRYTTENLWIQSFLPIWRHLLAAHRLAKEPERKHPIQVIGNVEISTTARQVLEKGPKFAIAPKLERVDNVALVRKIAAKAPQEKGPQIIDEGIQAFENLKHQGKAKKDSGAEVNPSGVQSRGSPQTSTESACSCPTAISDGGGGHTLTTATTSALPEDAGPGRLKPKPRSRRDYAHDTPLTQDCHAASRIARTGQILDELRCGCSSWRCIGTLVTPQAMIFY
ncbi:hypothetical protein ISCGN_031353 [Ixodes scapularis]